MPTHPKKRGGGRGAATPIVELIVRRGALRRFEKLKDATAELPVKLTWDKRLGERRGSANGVERERRRTDRRRNPPFTWDAADFVVVETRRAGGPKAKRRS